ncbi:MAG: phenylpropionate dioxygenase-like ring-hydroxylating dioxygenase large terminal subunit [Gammaproteobacteria bacterium]|jgi:phenylpropionate dioxygenase-like ring-hydroxylating dioxygenase large terminal subunit
MILKQQSDGIMNSKSFNDALSNCMRPVDEASSLPAACYHSEEILQSEIESIFYKGWLGLGRVDRFKEAGQYETMEIADVSVILIMDRDEKLHAFNNACRHRGARLLEGDGKCRAIRCPFHCWNYGVDGKLVAAPHMEDTKGFNYDTSGLVEFELKIHAGFIFVCFSQNPPDFEQNIGDFDQIHSPWPIEPLISTRRIRFESDCNWKLFLDVFNEYYHLPSVHPDSINDVYKKPDAGDITTGAYASQFGETEGTGGLLTDEQIHTLPPIPGLSGRTGTRYTWIFPNMTFAASTEAMWIYEAYPLGPRRCVVYQTLCFPQQSVDLPDFEEKVKYYYERFDAAVVEDCVALSNQQLGLNSPFTIPGRYSVGLEPNVSMFANWYAKQFQ